jgi:hypothetical protein
MNLLRMIRRFGATLVRVGNTYPLRYSCWAVPFLVPLARGRPTATVEGGWVRIRMGLLGSADVPIGRVARVGTMRWPWWGGLGARLGKGLVAFVAAPGEAALLELTEPLEVRAPLRWSTRRLVVGAEDLEGFVRAVAEARLEAERLGSED